MAEALHYLGYPPLGVFRVDVGLEVLCLPGYGQCRALSVNCRKSTFWPVWAKAVKQLPLQSEGLQAAVLIQGSVFSSA